MPIKQFLNITTNITSVVLSIDIILKQDVRSSDKVYFLIAVIVVIGKLLNHIIIFTALQNYMANCFVD